MKNKIYSNILYVLLCLFAFAIPFSTPNFPFINITPSFTALLVLIWLIEGDFSNKLCRIKTNGLLFPFILCTSLYFLYIVGLLYTKNIEYGLSDLLLKLPLLILPFVIFTLNPLYWTKKHVDTLLKLFVCSSLITLIISLIHSWILYKETTLFSTFFYGEASLFHHPSYASMYYCFSFIIIVYLFLTSGWNCLLEKMIGAITMILFSIEIILLESRAGILTFGSILMIYFFYILLFKRKLYPYIFIGFVSICITLIGAYKFLPPELNRVRLATDYIKEHYTSENPSQETYVRFLIWDASVKVGIKNMPFGVGTGDVKDELMKQYQKEDYQEPYEENLNAHCQYLQVFTTLGILGTILFLLIGFSSIWVGCRRKNILFTLFGVVTGINFLVESMLEKQAGVMFFVFFFVILYFVSQTQLLECKDNRDE